jgi:tetratricopeptide (TPR) repeat protein
VLCGAAAPDRVATDKGASDKVGPLFEALKTSTSEERSQALENQIALYWRSQITPAVQILLEQASLAAAHQDNANAIADLDAALDLQPEQADLWRLHAEARFANGDSHGALEDLAQALSREPRCFPALADLSRVSEADNDYPRALSAWQRFLEIDPKAPNGTKRLDALQRKVAGQPL